MLTQRERKLKESNREETEIDATPSSFTSLSLMTTTVYEGEFSLASHTFLSSSLSRPRTMRNLLPSLEARRENLSPLYSGM